MKRKMQKRSKTSNKMKGIIKYSSFATLLLTCIVIFTLSQVNDAKSRYKTESSGTSGATVAKWNVSMAPITHGTVFNMVAGNNTVEYSVKVTSSSQVSCSYTLIISNVPNDVKVSLDDGEEQTPSNNTVTFENVGSFIIGDGIDEKTHKLTFSAPIESNANTNQINIQAAFTQLN